jgi:hypothetical protein
MSVDLAVQRRLAGTMGPAHNVADYYPKKVDPVPSSEGARRYEGGSLTNIREAFLAKDVLHVRIWTELRHDQENSAVIGLYWVDKNTIRGICGKDAPKYGFEIQYAQVVHVTPLDSMTESLREEYLTRSIPENKDPGVVLPHVAGRQYLAVSSATADWNNGRTLCGTKDGMLALIDGENVFALGLTCYCGPVRSIITNEDKTVAWGTCGYDLDHNHIFRYDDKTGLRDFGLMVWIGGYDGPANPDILSCIALSPDEKQIATGGYDRLGSVFIAPLSD